MYLHFKAHMHIYMCIYIRDIHIYSYIASWVPCTGLLPIQEVPSLTVYCIPSLYDLHNASHDVKAGKWVVYGITNKVTSKNLYVFIMM